MENVSKLLKQLTVEEKAALCAGEDFWHTRGIARLGIPAMMMCDGPHGLRKQDGDADHLGIHESTQAICYPSAAGLAASFDRSLLERLGTALAEECQAENVGMLLGPGMNIKRSPLCGRNFEYFSEDPYLTGELGTSYVNALQKGGIAPCAKHFAANNQETMRMVGNSIVEERPLHEIYLAGFERMVKAAKPWAMMCSYNKINGTFASENHALLTDILRDRWGFDGCVVTDWGAVKNRVKGLYAGVDLEMPGGDKAQKIVDAVNSGTLEMAVLDQAVENILNLVARTQKHRKSNISINYEQHHALSGELAADCSVLLKNDRKVLPLSTTQKVAFLGAFAATPRYQGSGSSHINSYHVTSALEAAACFPVTYAQGYLLSGEADGALLAEAVKLAEESDAAVIFAGLPDISESEGFDRTHMNIPPNQSALIEAVAAVNPNTVVVLENGSPIVMPWANKVPAILEMYLAGEAVGEAEVKLLYGEVNPSGKLAETFPYKMSDNPSYLNFPGEGTEVHYHEGIYVGYRYYDKKEMPVQFPFGYGLSYTTFEYSNLSVSHTLAVSCKVKNTGSRAGKEVVQLYIASEKSNVGRPVRELKGFEKVMLEPGEEKQISFQLDNSSFAYYEPRIHDWFVESGNYMIEIGASSRDIKLTTSVSIEGATSLPLEVTAYTPVGPILTTQKGSELVGPLLANLLTIAREQQGDADTGMGEAGDEMGQSMLNEMPLASLCGYIGMDDDGLNALVSRLNS